MVYELNILIFSYSCFPHAVEYKMLPGISDLSTCKAQKTARQKLIWKYNPPVPQTPAPLTQLTQSWKGITAERSSAGLTQCPLLPVSLQPSTTALQFPLVASAQKLNFWGCLFLVLFFFFLINIANQRKKNLPDPSVKTLVDIMWNMCFYTSY